MKKLVIKTKDVFKKIRKPAAKPSVVEKNKKRYNRKKTKKLFKKLLSASGIENEEDI